MSQTITETIPMAIDLLINLIEVAKKAKELSRQDFEAIKKKLDKKFSNIPTWDEL